MPSRSLVALAVASILFGSGCASGRAAAPGVLPTGAPMPLACTPPATAQLRTILYFGLARPAGTISEQEWQAFVRQEVTPRFPEGLTVWEVDGQWRGADGRIIEERSKVLLLVHPDTPTARAAILSLIQHYKQAFEQESVLWETTPVCVMF